MDTYSDYIEVGHLEDLTSSTLINTMKQVFAINGVPVMLLSDNGTNYPSQDFKQFAKTGVFSI